MKVPTIGTSVFSPILSPSSDALGTQKTTNFPVDMQLYATTDGGSNYAVDRLRAVSTTASNVGGVYLYTNATDVEGDGGSRFWNSTGFQISNTYQGLRTIYWNFRRAPSFMDVVCYRGSNTSNSQKPHNLKAVPELIIIKSRNFARHWNVYHKDLPPSGGLNAFMEMDSTDAINHDSSRFYSTPTADNFILGNNDEVNGNYNYVAYLFSTCAGVSKVFSYTGNGSSQTINCGFTAGARWIMIKRTNSSGDWYIWDSARGIVSGSDPHLSLNTTAAEVTTDDTIDTDSTGFVVNQVSATNVNVSSSTYIGIAIA
jgi:hypothetical protein